MTRLPGEGPDEGAGLVRARGARERVARSCVVEKEPPTEDLHNSRGDRDARVALPLSEDPSIDRHRAND